MDNLPPFKKMGLYLSVLVVILYTLLLPVDPAHCLSDREMENPAVLADQGWKCIDNGTCNYDQAEGFFRKALRLDSRNSDAYAGLGYITRMKGYISYFKYKTDACRESLDFTEKAIQFNKMNSRAHYNKGEALLCLGDFDGALREADLLESAGYKGCLAHLIRSRAYRGKTEKKNNASDRQMAILEATDNLECSQKTEFAYRKDEALRLLEEILTETKDYDSTVEYFKSNVESRPDIGSSYTNYVWILLLRNRGNDLDVAERTVRKARDVTNNYMVLSVIHRMRGDKYAANGKYEKARAEYIKCLVENPHEQDARQKIVDLCHRLGDTNCIATWRKLIQAYLDKGICENAVNEYEVFSMGYPGSLDELKEAISQCGAKPRKKATSR